MKLRQILVAAIAVLFVLPLTAATTWYVNGSSGSDSYTGRSESSAKATIQAAIDASSAGDTILVAPGTYTPIRTNGKRITIRSTSGAANTIIDGGGTSMCANLGHDVRATRLVGFTLQNGNSGGYEAGGTLGGTAVSCIYRNNRGKNYAGSSAAATSAVINCLAYGNVFLANGRATFNRLANGTRSVNTVGAVLTDLGI